jgi:hypothetical protein
MPLRRRDSLKYRIDSRSDPFWQVSSQKARRMAGVDGPSAVNVFEQPDLAGHVGQRHYEPVPADCDFNLADVLR